MVEPAGVPEPVNGVPSITIVPVFRFTGDVCTGCGAGIILGATEEMFIFISLDFGNRKSLPRKNVFYAYPFSSQSLNSKIFSPLGHTRIHYEQRKIHHL
jgi:hypothetical protein